MGDRSSEADFLNTLLRENYQPIVQVKEDDDWRHAFGKLVDGVRYGAEYQFKSHIAKLEKVAKILEAEKNKFGCFCPHREMDIEKAMSDDDTVGNFKHYHYCVVRMEALAALDKAGTS